MKRILRMACPSCGHWNSVPVNKIFLEQDTPEPKVRAYIRARASNFVFKVGGVPQGILERVRNSKLKKKPLLRKNQLIEGRISSIDSKESEQKGLPKICLMDSGVNDIPVLSKLIVLKDGLTGFNDFNDGCSPIHPICRKTLYMKHSIIQCERT